MADKNQSFTDLEKTGLNLTGIVLGATPTKKDPAKRTVKLLAGDEVHQVLTRLNGFGIGDMIELNHLRSMVTDSKQILYFHGE